MTPNTPNALNGVQHRRKSQVFVEIPVSPFLKSYVASTPSKVDEPSVPPKPESHKENAIPLSTKALTNNIPEEAKGKGKRELEQEDRPTNSKKARVAKGSNDGTLVACHQCRSKKLPDLVLQCTSNSKATGKRCKASYCDTCLRTRYGERLEAISKRELPQSREGHDPDTEYHFTCPRCDGHCNCAPCRKKQGLAPVGKFTSTQTGESVREILEKNPQASGLLPKHTVIPDHKQFKLAKGESLKYTQTVTEKKKPLNSKEKNKDIIDSKTKKLQAVPEPVWVPVPLVGTRQEIEDRIYLREFILRFNPILNIGFKNLEDLDDFTSLHDQSTKAVLLALLDLIAIEDESQKKMIQVGVKRIRSLGLNWTKIAPVLYELRDSSPNAHALRSLPDPKQSDKEVSYNTRGTSMQALYADQMLPLLLHLVEIVANGASLKTELEEGHKQRKEVRAAYLKAQREETERWATERIELTEEKSQGEKGKEKWDFSSWKAKYRKAESDHKAIVSDIHNSFKPEMDSCASRFMALGYDFDGRTYYTLSACCPQRGKKERLPSEGERSSMKRWGWFVAVWGKPGSVQEKGEDAMAEDDPNAERWWGFADVQEMRKLSKWLTYRSETDILPKKGHNKKSDSVVNMQGAGTPATTSVLMPSAPSSRLPVPSRTTTGSEAGNPPLLLPALSVSSSGDGAEKMDVDKRDTDDDDGDSDVSQPATQPSVKALAKGVLEFADFVAWRLRREETLGRGRRSEPAIAVEKFYE